MAAPAFAQSAEETTEQAQQQPPAPQATAAPNDEGREVPTDEIVVTARRTAELLQNVPASVSAFNERALDRIQATDTTGLQGAVPNLNIVQGRGSSNSTNIYIRGIGQPDALQTFDPAVGVYVDDVYLSRIRGNQLDLLDLERLEVLRGPQGTLYGKNTIGGAIKFITRKPSQDFRASGSVALGSYNQFDLKGAASGPVSETVAIGFALMRAHRDGFVEDSVDDREYNDRDTVAGRAALAFVPSSNFRVDLSADYSHDDTALTVGRPVNNLVTAFLLPLPVENPVDGGDSYDWTGRTTPGLPNSTKLEHYGFSGTAALDVTEFLTLKSITAYRDLDTEDYIDIDASQWEIGDVFVGVDQRQFSQEFQMAYTGDRLRGVAGLYYLKEDIKSHQEAYVDDLLRFSYDLPPFTFLRLIDDDLTTRSYAAYANASYELVPTLSFSAGLRYTKETKDYFRVRVDESNFPGLAGSFTFAPPEGEWNDWSPMASIDWQATPSTMLYGRVAKGFKSGGFNGRANTAAESTAYEPESVWSYEAGFKTTLMDQLRLNGAVFHNDYRDFQARVSGLDEDPNTGLPLAVLSVINAGKLRIRGAELEAGWTPTRSILLDAQIGYLDAEYKDFDDARFTDFDGSRAFQTPAFSPKWTMRYGAQYSVDLGNAGGITLGAQTRYKSRTALVVDNTLTNSDEDIDALFQNAYWVHDARIVWESASSQFAVGLYGNNLADREFKTDAQEFSSVGGTRTVYYGAPRTFTLRLTARY